MAARKNHYEMSSQVAGSSQVMTDRHDTGLLRPHLGEMTTDLGRLERVRARLGQASVGMAPLAWVGVRSVVLITVSMLVILVGLPAALVAAGN